MVRQSLYNETSPGLGYSYSVLVLEYCISGTRTRELPSDSPCTRVKIKYPYSCISPVLVLVLVNLVLAPALDTPPPFIQPTQ